MPTTTSLSARNGWVELLGCAFDDCLEHDASIDFVVAVEYASQGGSRLLDSHFGQEAKSAKIYAQDRNPPRCDQARDAEQRAVAAEHDDQIGTIGELMTFDGLGADLFRRLGVRERSLVPGAKKAGESSRDGDRVGPLVLDDQADRLYGSLRHRNQALIMR